MGLINWLVQWDLRREARRLAKVTKEFYKEAKIRMPDASETEVIKGMFFDGKKLAELPEKNRKRIELCCQTVNGFCYMMALDFGRFKNLMNFRSLQFTSYMDRELIARGFPKQTIDQKREILEVMGLAIDGWEKWV